MTNVTFLEAMGIMTCTATVVTLLTRRFYVPNIVAYILSGVLLGPVFGLLDMRGQAGGTDSGVHHSIELVSETGIVLLLFLVGLELSLAKLRDIGRVAVYAGIGQVVFTAIGGFFIALLLDFDTMSSIFLATALTFSSTVVVVKLLDQKSEIQSLYGRIAVGIFLVQDLVVIVILTFLAGLADPGQMEAGAIAWGIAKAFLGMAALLLVALLATRFVLPRPFRWAARSPETLFIWSLTWCLVCVLGAELLGLSPEIGAFLAGMSLAQLDCAHELLRRVQPLMNFFIAIFFVALGANMQLGDALNDWGSSLALSLFVLIGNPVIFIIIILRHGYDKETAFLTSVTVAQISEFSFIFVAMGVSSGLVEPRILSVTALVGFATIAASSYMILYNHQLYRWSERVGLLRIFRTRPSAAPADLPTPTHPILSDHVVVIGMNALGVAVVDRLGDLGETVLAIDQSPDALAGLECMTLVGDIDHFAVFDEAGVARAKAVIATMRNEETTYLLAWRCARLNVPIIVQATDAQQVQTARELGITALVNTRLAGAKKLEHALAELGFMGHPHPDTRSDGAGPTGLVDIGGGLVGGPP